MKSVKIKEELRLLDVQQLKERMHALSREAFTVKMQSRISHVKDVSCFAKYRKDIARIQTLLRQKELGKAV